MKTFEEPKVEIMLFAVNDVITTSEPGFFTNPCI